jgi:hypothetical protein
MAQVVGYFEDHVVYQEGPFVISNPLGNGWRIEVEMKEHRCPVLPDLSIYRLMEQLSLKGKTNDQAEAARICDQLNRRVLAGRIVLLGKSWIVG